MSKDQDEEEKKKEGRKGRQDGDTYVIEVWR
jgi:hypothetical protein